MDLLLDNMWEKKKIIVVRHLVLLKNSIAETDQKYPEIPGDSGPLAIIKKKERKKEKLNTVRLINDEKKVKERYLYLQ